MAIELRLLGPFEATSDGAALPLGGPKQRAVLVLLALGANQIVSVDRLIDELWGGAAPPTVESYIQNCVSRLRKVLGRDTIETRAPGYVLRLDPEAIDVHRFEHALRRAHGLEPAERAETLAQALAVWRGPALADFRYEPFAQGEQARLDELRLEALEGRVGALLDLGQGSELVGELDALVRANPGRERLRAHQMVALYRSGRQGDALRTYHDARVALVETTGVEPGDELRRLHRRILAHDPTLLPPGAAVAHERPAGSRRRVTIVAVRFQVEEGRDPEEEAQRTADVRDAFAGAAWRHGGGVEHHLGDELVLAFGLPAAHEDDGLRALRVALEAREELAGRGVAVRVGAESGEVLVGPDLGDLTGGAVTAARRLADRADPGELVLGLALAGLVDEAAILEPAGHDHARRLVRLEEGRALLERPRTPLVGRERELEALRRAFAEATGNGRARVCVLIGDPGVGKTRLAAEIAALLPARVATGRCVPYGAASLQPLREIVMTLLGSSQDVAEALAAALGGSEDDDARAAQLLRVALGVERGQAAVTDTFWALRRLLERLGKSEPLLLVVEDAHWASEAVRDFVDHLRGGGATARMLLVVAGRPELLEERPAWEEHALVLEPLPPCGSRRLVEALPGRAELGEEDVERLLAAAEGNPLFLEQLVEHARETAPGERAPPTLAGLLASRLDRVDPLERGVLERAAVAGRLFTTLEVRALTPFAERDGLERRLTRLVRRRLVRTGGDGGFLFEHALVRDAAYAAIPKGVRADLHERLGRWLADRGGPDESAGFHLEQAYLAGVELGQGDAELGEQAGRMLGAAGIRALQRYDNPAAADLLGRAAGLLPEDEPWRLELACEHGLALKNAGETDRALAALDDVVERAREAGDERVELRSRVEQLWPRLLRGETDPDASLALLERTIAACERVHDYRGLARAWQLVAAVKGALLGRRAESEEAARRSLDHYRVTGAAPRGCVHLLAAGAACGSRSLGEARAILERLRSEPNLDLASLADLASLDARLVAMAGDFAEARALIAEAEATYRRLRDSGSLAGDWASDAALVELLAGNNRAADTILEHACARAAASGDRARYGSHLAMRAEVALAQGDAAEAKLLAEQSRSTCLGYDVVPQAHWRRVLARALAEVDPRGAVDLAHEAVDLLERTDELDELAEAYLALGEVLGAGGREAEAVAAVERSRAFFEAKENVVRAGTARAAVAPPRE